jgi:hypothetical protein
MTQSHPKPIKRLHDRPDLFIFDHIWFKLDKRVQRKRRLTMSLGFGANVTVEPLGCLPAKFFATTWAYGTAAREANP